MSWRKRSARVAVGRRLAVSRERGRTLLKGDPDVAQEQKLLFAPALAFVHTIPPFNLPDTNYVGLQRQLDDALGPSISSSPPTFACRWTDARSPAERRWSLTRT
jgi:hypothetical protein